MGEKTRIVIAGMGKLGTYLADKIRFDERVSNELELVGVWNRTPGKIGEEIPHALRLKSLDDVASVEPDLFVEVAAPSVTVDHGERILGMCNYLIGTPTALVDDGLRDRMFTQAEEGEHALIIPYGALLGVQVIESIVGPFGCGINNGSITMRKDYSSIRIGDYAASIGFELPPKPDEGEDVVIYEGPLRKLAQLFPNNVNTMVTFSLVSKLGLDMIVKLVGATGLGAHQISWETTGPMSGGDQFGFGTRRHNPAIPGAVTGNRTYESFLESTYKAAQVQGNGVLYK
jgi:aspartate dehydrogenase